MTINSTVNDALDTLKTTVALAPPAFTFAGFTLEEWMYWVSITAGLFLILERVPRVISSWMAMWRKWRDGNIINEG